VLTHIKEVIVLSLSKQTLKACICRPPIHRQALVGTQKEVLTFGYIAMEFGVEIKMGQTIQRFVMLREPQNTFLQSNQTVSHQLIMIYSKSKRRRLTTGLSEPLM
jgi:hypothetical protein